VCALQGPARVAQVSSDEDTRAQREKTESESAEEPQCREPTHADRGMDCDRFDQETPAAGGFLQLSTSRSGASVIE
jgi:hypothetical protein